MKQVVLNIPDNKYPFFMELVKSLGFVKVTSEPKLTKKQHEFVDDLQNSLHQVKLMQEGKIEKQSAEDFLNEL